MTARAWMLGALALAACGSSAAEPAGIGPWDVTKSTLADATGRCDPTDLDGGRKGMWCYLQPALKLGEQAAAVDLYFGGTAPTASLVEIQLQIKACKTEDAHAWMTQAFGNPAGFKGTRFWWEKRHVLIVAEMPGAASRCNIRVFPVSERATYDRVKAGEPPAP